MKKMFLILMCSISLNAWVTAYKDFPCCSGITTDIESIYRAGLTTDIEFLYWTASYDFPYTFGAQGETITLTPPPGVATSTLQLLQFNGIHAPQHWDPGVRLGIGCSPCHHSWDWRLAWTYFRNRASTHINSTTQKLTIAFTSAAVKVTSSYNVVDLEVGHEFCLRSIFHLRRSKKSEQIYANV